MLDNYVALKQHGYEPRMPIAMKAARTVYCYGFDNTLLVTYSEPTTMR